MSNPLGYFLVHPSRVAFSCGNRDDGDRNVLFYICLLDILTFKIFKVKFMYPVWMGAARGEARPLVVSDTYSLWSGRMVISFLAKCNFHVLSLFAILNWSVHLIQFVLIYCFHSSQHKNYLILCFPFELSLMLFLPRPNGFWYKKVNFSTEKTFWQSIELAHSFFPSFCTR